MKQQRWNFYTLLKTMLLPELRRTTLRGDLLRLLLLLALDLAVVNNLSPAHLIDLTSAGLTFFFISRPAPRSLLLLLVAAITLEQHSSMPAGTYICAYLIAMTVLILMRQEVAWRSYFPWLVSFASVQAWVVGFEFLVYLVKDPSFFAHNFAFICSQSLRIASSVLIGSLFYLNSSKALGEDHAFDLSS
jgi:hypothetical protein